MPPFHWATICSRPCRPLPVWGLTLERQRSAIIGEIVPFLHSDYAAVTLDTLWIRLRYDLFTMYLRRNCRFWYVLHTLIHDPKPIATDPMTIYLRWRRSWCDVGRPGYAHADQLTLWVRSNRRYLSWPYKYRRRSLPIHSSCPSIPWIQYTVPCIWFIFLNSLAFSSNSLPCTTIPMVEHRWLLNWSHCRQNRSNRSSAEQIKRSHCYQNSLERPQ